MTDDHYARPLRPGQTPRYVLTVGQSTRVYSPTFRDTDGTTTNPSTVTLKIKKPSSAAGTAPATTTYTYGVDAALVRDGTGSYYYDDLILDVPGEWRLLWGCGSQALIADRPEDSPLIVIIVHPSNVP